MKSRIALSLFLLLLASCGKPSASSKSDAFSAIRIDPGFVKANFGIENLETVACAGVEKMTAVDPGSRFESGDGRRVWIHSRFDNGKEQNVVHRYFKAATVLSGDRGFFVPFHEQSLHVGASKTWAAWSWVHAVPGTYRVDVVGPDGSTVMKRISFEVTGKADEPPFLSTSEDLGLESSVLASAVVNGVAKAADAFPAGSKVHVWMSFAQASAPTTAWLAWWKKETSVDGKTDYVRVATLPVAVKGSPWKTWNFLECGAGDWKVEILTADGAKILAEHSFRVGN